MPIIIKKFTWSQTEDEVILRVPLKNVGKLKPDFHIYYTYIKVYCGNMFLELFLRHPIDMNASRCKIFEHELRFYLKKTVALQWTDLQREVVEKQKVKEFVMKKTEVMLSEQEQEASLQKEEKKREEVRKEIEKQSVEQQLIDSYKNNCKKGFYEQWKQTWTATNQTKARENAEKSKNIEVKKSKAESEIRILPPIRNSQSIEVAFTERRFCTPQRESQDELEKEWLIRQADVQRQVGFIESDLLPEERDPRYLKTKAEDFGAKKNYFGAISAYSTAIKISKEPNYELFMGRADMQFKAGNFKRSAEDYSEAYNLLPEDLKVTSTIRARCVWQRALALFNIGFKNEAIRELEIAVRTDPTNGAIKLDLERMEDELDNE